MNNNFRKIFHGAADPAFEWVEEYYFPKFDTVLEVDCQDWTGKNYYKMLKYINFDCQLLVLKNVSPSILESVCFCFYNEEMSVNLRGKQLYIVPRPKLIIIVDAAIDTSEWGDSFNRRFNLVKFKKEVGGE